MGNMSDMMLDGTVCQFCGQMVDMESPGYPRTCNDCQMLMQEPFVPLEKLSQGAKCAGDDPICLICGKGEDLADDQKCPHEHFLKDNQCPMFECAFQNRSCSLDCPYLDKKKSYRVDIEDSSIRTITLENVPDAVLLELPIEEVKDMDKQVKPRKLADVIDQMIEKIPDSESDLIMDLEEIKRSIFFTAPEAMGLRWDEVYDLMEMNIPELKANYEGWHYEMASIFSTKPIEKLKELNKL